MYMDITTHAMCHNSQFNTTCVCNVCNATNNNTSLIQCHTKCMVSIVYVILSNNNKAYNVFYSYVYSTVARYSSQAYWRGRLASRCKDSVSSFRPWSESFLAVLYWSQLGLLSADRSILVCSLNSQPGVLQKSKWRPNRTYAVSHSYVKSYWYISLLHNTVFVSSKI